MYKVTKSDIKTKTKSEVDIFDFFFDLKVGQIKKHKTSPKAKCNDLAGTSIILPKFKMQGKGEAYHS